MIVAYCGMLFPLLWGHAEYEEEVIEEVENFDDSEICPVELFEKYEWDCVNHLDEWTP
jgi:hypothetical protein